MKITDEIIIKEFYNFKTKKKNSNKLKEVWLNNHLEIKNYLLNRFSKDEFISFGFVIDRIIHKKYKLKKCKICKSKIFKISDTCYCSKHCACIDPDLKKKKAKSGVKTRKKNLEKDPHYYDESIKETQRKKKITQNKKAKKDKNYWKNIHKKQEKTLLEKYNDPHYNNVKSQLRTKKRNLKQDENYYSEIYRKAAKKANITKQKKAKKNKNYWKNIINKRNKTSFKQHINKKKLTNFITKVFNINEIKEFKHNKFFYEYLELIKANPYTKKKKKGFQNHHIIPRAFYKLNNAVVDNSSNNLCTLSLKDHILAHYYICKFIKDTNSELFTGMKSCIALMTKKYKISYNDKNFISKLKKLVIELPKSSSWNKGLTAKTDKRVKKLEEKRLKALFEHTGKRTPTKGKIWTQEQRNTLSKALSKGQFKNRITLIKGKSIKRPKKDDIKLINELKSKGYKEGSSYQNLPDKKKLYTDSLKDFIINKILVLPIDFSQLNWSREVRKYFPDIHSPQTLFKRAKIKYFNKDNKKIKIFFHNKPLKKERILVFKNGKKKYANEDTLQDLLNKGWSTNSKGYIKNKICYVNNDKVFIKIKLEELYNFIKLGWKKGKGNNLFQDFNVKKYKK